MWAVVFFMFSALCSSSIFWYIFVFVVIVVVVVLSLILRSTCDRMFNNLKSEEEEISVGPPSSILNSLYRPQITNHEAAGALYSPDSRTDYW